MIEYLYTEGKTADESCPIKVRLDGKICGRIEKVIGGFAYRPKGVTGAFYGETFDTVQKVQESLSCDS